MRRVLVAGNGRASVCILGTIVSVGFVAYFAAMTGFATSDDEGYFLVSLRAYNHGTPLFQEIYSQYGPFYWQAVGGFFAATGITIDLDTGRLFALLLWGASAGFVAAAAWRLTRSVLISCGVAALVLHTLYVFPSESLHPGAPIVLLLAVLAYALTSAGRWSVMLAGALIAALLLMKINVGCFALLSVLLVLPGGMALAALETRWRRLLNCLFCLGPLVLMLPEIGSGYLPYGLHIALLATAFVIVLAAFPLVRADEPDGSLAWLLAAFAAFIVADVLLTWGTGSSLASIWGSVVRDALSQPNVFAFPPEIASSALVLDLVSVGLAVFALVYRDTLRTTLRGPRGTAGLGLLRIAGGSITWLAMTTMAAPLALPVTATWLAAVPSTLDEGNRRWSIRAIAAVALLQTLHAYPVAGGGQKSWSSFMLVLVAGVLISDGAREVGSALASPFGRGVVQGVAGVAMAVALLVALVLALPTYVNAFRAASPFDLPGAHLVRTDAETVSDLRAVTTAIDKRCSTFVSMPGLDSFYLFTGQTPPTLLLTSGWMLAVGEADQQRAVSEVEAAKGVCLLRDDSLVAFWLGQRALPSRPLVNYVVAHTAGATSLPGGYELAPPP